MDNNGWEISSRKKSSMVKKLKGKSDSINVSNTFVDIEPMMSDAWGDNVSDDDNDTDETETLSAIKDKLDKEQNFEKKMSFLQSVMTSIASNAAALIESERVKLNSASLSNDKETLRRLHDLSTYGKSFQKSMTDKLSVIACAINDIDKQYTEILKSWESFVNGLTQSDKKTVKEVSYLDALGVSNDSPKNKPKNVGSTYVARVGIANIRTYTAAHKNDVPLMGIRYIPELSTFVVNLDGIVYSFGNGKFTTRGSSGEKSYYGKRCTPRLQQCGGENCTYYHDPLYFPNNGSPERNMAIHYIIEDLIRGVASDREILSNPNFARNTFIVEDLVQLGGMLMLKAMAVKSVLNKNKQKHR